PALPCLPQPPERLAGGILTTPARGSGQRHNVSCRLIMRIIRLPGCCASSPALLSSLLVELCFPSPVKDLIYGHQERIVVRPLRLPNRIVILEKTRKQVLCHGRP